MEIAMRAIMRPITRPLMKSCVWERVETWRLESRAAVPGTMLAQAEQTMAMRRLRERGLMTDRIRRFRMEGYGTFLCSGIA
jgi:hypothetical protein